jgi:hypothetical protein
MNVKLTKHAAALLEAVRAQRHEPIENILEQALEVLAREEHITPQESSPTAAHRQAVSEMLDFVRHNRVHLGAGLSVKDLIHEGHRV